MNSLPPLTAEQSLGLSIFTYRKLAISHEVREVNPFSVSLAHRDLEPGKYQLAACTRTVHFGHKPGMPTKHCYLRLRDNQQRTRDSLSFSKGFPAASSDTKPDCSSAQCQTIDIITAAQWQQFRAYFQEHGDPKDFSLRQYNCCSCVKNSVESILKKQIPDHIATANTALGIPT